MCEEGRNCKCDGLRGTLSPMSKKSISRLTIGICDRPLVMMMMVTTMNMIFKAVMYLLII